MASGPMLGLSTLYSNQTNIGQSKKEDNLITMNLSFSTNTIKITWFATIVLVAILVLPSFNVSNQLHAQTAREIEDWQFQYEKYQEVYEAYDVSKNAFLKQNTLASQQEAVTQTQALIIQRSQVLRTYFFALRYQILNNPGVDLTEKSNYSSLFDTEIGWLQNHMDDVGKIVNPSLTQLFEISDRLETKERNIVTLSYEARAINIIGKVRNLHQRLVTINTNLSPYISQVSETAPFLNNWEQEAQSNGHAALQSIQRAEAALVDLQRSGGEEAQLNRVFSVIQAEAQTATRQLRTGIGFQREILTELQKNLPAKQQSESASEDEEQAPAVEEDTDNSQ
jgi:hypothetical protein